jgi:hypothetical protein
MWLVRLLLPWEEQVTGADILRIVQAGRMGGPQRVEAMYQWHIDRLYTMAKGIAAAALSFLTAVVVAYLTTESGTTVNSIVAIALAIGSLVILTLAAQIAWRVSRLPHDYAASLRFFETMAQVTPGFPGAPWS